MINNGKSVYPFSSLLAPIASFKQSPQRKDFIS